MKLVVLLGPTGVGKTDLSISLAHALDSPVISCDSRQIYKEMSIGTAVPSAEQLSSVRHYFIQSRSVTDNYDAYRYETEALELISSLFASGHESLVMCGGSMMYIDAVCNGIDDIPSIPPELRNELNNLYREKGLDPIREELKVRDPEFYSTVDLNNTQRVIHALEVCRVSGQKYSSLRTNRKKKRDFDIVKVGLSRDREELYRRIDCRVDMMLRDGLEEEVRSLSPLRGYNALNTVGYREFFSYFDGKIPYEEAVRLIKRNSRHYARKQLTWFRRDGSIKWFHPEDVASIKEYIL